MSASQGWRSCGEERGSVCDASESRMLHRFGYSSSGHNQARPPSNAAVVASAPGQVLNAVRAETGRRCDHCSVLGATLAAAVTHHFGQSRAPAVICSLGVNSFRCSLSRGDFRARLVLMSRFFKFQGGPQAAHCCLALGELIRHAVNCWPEKLRLVASTAIFPRLLANRARDGI
jgi:hypothetical protein